MPRPARSIIVDPEALRPREREAFTRRLFATHDRIFEGVSYEEFRDYVVESKASWTRIQVYECDAGEVVGYFAFHSFERRFQGAPCMVHRAETGMLKAYRGGAACAGFLARAFSQQLLKHRGKQHYFLGSLVHPSAYCGLSRHLDEIWPCPERPTPAPIEAFMHELADSFGLKPLQGRDLGIRKVGWVTRDSHSDKDRWARNPDPRVRLFLSRNPGFRQGHGMLTLIPMSPGIVVRGFSRHLEHKLRRSLFGKPSGQGAFSAQEADTRPVHVG